METSGPDWVDQMQNTENAGASFLHRRDIGVWELKKESTNSGAKLPV